MQLGHEGKFHEEKLIFSSVLCVKLAFFDLLFKLAIFNQ